MTGSSPLLDVHALTVTIDGLGDPVRDASLSLREGEMLALVGESGSGKTLTALSLMRLLPPGVRIGAGSVRIDGTDLLGLDGEALRAHRGGVVSMIFQDPMSSLNPTMTVGSQIAEAVLLHEHTTKDDAWNRALRALREVGIPAAERRMRDYPHQLSGGMRQRVMIAMALVCGPRLLIADEPTTALDVIVQKQILDLIDDIRRQRGMGVILVTHDLGLVARYADRVAVMYGGRIVEEGPARRVVDKPRHPYTRALLQASPESTGAPRGALPTIPGRPPTVPELDGACPFAPRCERAVAACRDGFPDPVRTEGGVVHCFVPLEASDAAAVSTARVTDAAPLRSAEDAEVLIQLVDVVRTFDVGNPWRWRRDRLRAVDGVSLSVRAGRTLAIVGESGSGKTTLGRVIAGVDRPTSGEVVRTGPAAGPLRGRTRRDDRRWAQFMFQDSAAAMNPRMTIGDIIDEPLRLRGEATAADRRERVTALLAEVGLNPDVARRRPADLSGGQRQRVGFARALATDPAVIVADEPVSALDVSVQAQVLNLMSDLSSRTGTSFVTITHDLGVVRHIADDVAVMYLGRLVEVGPASRVLEAPAHPYTRALLDAVPTLDSEDDPGGKAELLGDMPSPIAPPTGCRFRTRCPLARPTCAEAEPLLRTAPSGTALVACHFPLTPAVERRDR